ncbi:MAG: hypothetical protein HY075_16395 [Deltaproteobacteria bacterium]|nr:hypothetical protein [Deltaproteobacteria bacterium]
MMTGKMIKINGVEESFPADATMFEEFIDGLSKKLSAERRVISCIKIDGQELSEDAEKQLKTMPLEQMGQIEVETANPADLAFQTLNTLDQYIDRLVASIQRAAAHYRGKNLIAGDAYFAKSIDGLDLFVQTIGGVKLALRIGLNTQIALAEAELISVMNDLLDAKRQNNYLYMAELLEKELTQNLGEWKTTVFPLIRTLTSS